MKSLLDCPHCNQATEATVAPGKYTRCRHCKERFRAPLGSAQAPSVEFECPECGATTRSVAAPGQKTLCKHCKARVRVPLRDPDAASEDEEAEPVVRRTCPGCGEKVAGHGRRCSECGCDMDQALQAQRYSDLEGDRPTVLGAVHHYGLIGGVFAVVGSVAWFVAGLLEGDVYVFPPVLFVVGLGVTARGLTGRRRPR